MVGLNEKSFPVVDDVLLGEMSMNEQTAASLKAIHRFLLDAFGRYLDFELGDKERKTVSQEFLRDVLNQGQDRYGVAAVVFRSFIDDPDFAYQFRVRTDVHRVARDPAALTRTESRAGLNVGVKIVEALADAVAGCAVDFKLRCDFLKFISELRVRFVGVDRGDSLRAEVDELNGEINALADKYSSLKNPVEGRFGDRSAVIGAHRALRAAYYARLYPELSAKRKAA